MAWQDRLREAAYTSPSGTRVVFLYENLRRRVTRRTTAFEFPGVDGTFVQQLGRGGRRYPIRVYISGEDYDIQAAEFEDAILEDGVGRLEHPIHGPLDVVPFGEITRRDDLKTAANQAIIEVVFWESSGVAFPLAATDSASEVIQAVDDYNEAKAQEFAEQIDVDSVSEEATLKNRYELLLATVSEGLSAVASTTAEVEAQFNAILNSIQLGIDTLVSDPLTLAFQTSILIQAPARAAAAITDRFNAYANLLNLIVDQGTADNEQAYRTADLYASGYVTGAVLSSVNNTFATKPDALAAAETVLDGFELLVDWRDDNLQGLDVIDPGAAYQKLQEAVAVAAGFLVEISFTLRQERRIVLDRPRSAIDLAAELYGEVDPVLDFLINSNNLTGSEILEIPRGRTIVYYV